MKIYSELLMERTIYAIALDLVPLKIMQVNFTLSTK